VNEPATTLTDYLLALIALVFLAQLARADTAKRLIGARMFFFAFALSAISGGTWHGFFSGGNESIASRVIWWLTLTFTAIAACGLAAIALERFGWHNARALLLGSAIFVTGFAFYAWWDRRFLVTLVVTGAATLLCLAGLIFQARRHPRSGGELAAAGLLLSLPAALLQQSRVAIHPVHFDHNATYHLWLMAVLALFYLGNRRIGRSSVSL
jgi:hypothetical protein